MQEIVLRLVVKKTISICVNRKLRMKTTTKHKNNRTLKRTVLVSYICSGLIPRGLKNREQSSGTKFYWRR